MSTPSINVTPLIDVLLVLLIIFMVITPTKPGRLEARIPPEPNKDDISIPHPLSLVVVLKPDSSLWLNSEKIRASVEVPGELVAKLKTVFDLRTRNMVFSEKTESGQDSRVVKAVFIKAPRNMPYGNIVKVVDAVKMAGAFPVGLQIDDLDR